MLSGESEDDYRFPVKVNLVIVKLSLKEPVVGILKDGFGKLVIPEKNVTKNKTSADIAKELVHRYIRVDGTREYDVEMCSVHDKRHRYIGHAVHDIAIVYRAFIPSDFECDNDIAWYNPKQIIEFEEGGLFDKDYSTIIQEAMVNGL